MVNQTLDTLCDVEDVNAKKSGKALVQISNLVEILGLDEVTDDFIMSSHETFSSPLLRVIILNAWRFNT